MKEGEKKEYFSEKEILNELEHEIKCFKEGLSTVQEMRNKMIEILLKIQ